jgi:hypothetical protein
MVEKSKSNLISRLWFKIGNASILTHKLNDYIQSAKIAMMQMLRSIENKRTFNNELTYYQYKKMQVKVFYNVIIYF